MSHNNLAKTSMLIEAQLFLNSVERYTEALKNHRGIVITEDYFNKSCQLLIENTFPFVAGLVESLDGGLINHPGKTRLKAFLDKLKSWGL